MLRRSTKLQVLARQARRHWLLLAVAGLTLVALLAGQPAFAADVRPDANQTVPPPTPKPSVPPPSSDKKSDKKEEKQDVTKTESAAAVGAASVLVSDQESDGASVTVDSVTAAVDGWMVIHADADGAPGPVLGETAVPAGTTHNVVVMLDPALTANSRLWAMLHIDAGKAGVYEFPGPDAPAKENSDIVMAPFAVTVSEASAAAAAEATTEATAAATLEATATATAEAAAEAPTAVTAEATAAATDQAPESLPATGGDSSTPLAAAVAGVALLVLAAAAFAHRRSV